MAKTGRYSQDNAAEDIEVYLARLDSKLRSFSNDHIAAFVASLAERRLSERVDASQDKGILTALDAAWRHIQGVRLAETELKQLHGQVAAGQGTVARDLVRMAIEACMLKDNVPTARQAALADYEAALKPIPGYPEDLAARREVWRQPEVAAVISRQQDAVFHLSHPIMNEFIIDFLRRDARSKTPFRMSSTTFTLPTRPVEIGGKKTELPYMEPGKIDDSLPNSGILQNLASILGKLQQGNFPAEILKKVGESGIVTSQSEKDHARLLESTMASWENTRRTLFAVLLASRWLKEYETFSTAEGWGDPGALRRALAVSWDHLLGKPLSRSIARRISEKIIENTPDTEDFDAPLALAACEILDRTLDCCLEKDNLDSAVSAAMAACSSLAMLGQGLGYRGDNQAEEEQLWQQPAVREEIAFQAGLLERIASLSSLDAGAIRKFQGEL